MYARGYNKKIGNIRREGSIMEQTMDQYIINNLLNENATLKVELSKANYIIENLKAENIKLNESEKKEK